MCVCGVVDIACVQEEKVRQWQLFVYVYAWTASAAAGYQEAA